MKNLLLLFASTLVLSFAACGDATQTSSTDQPDKERRSAGQTAIQDEGSDPNIVQIALGSEDHTTLVAALEAADYVDFLGNPGPFTVFAPTNQAFEDLPDGVVDNLLKPENVDDLKDVLEFHVLIGVYEQPSIKDGQRIGTANVGLRPLEFTKSEDGSVQVNGHNILASVRAANGVVHVIDGVLVP
nr:fasciclin domain-containing protein [Saprospiraceae bacterium]